MARPPHRRIWRFTIVIAVLFVLWLSANIALAMHSHYIGTIDNAQPADTIIVLGAGFGRGGRPSPAMIRRTDRAANLYHEGLSQNVICTGGLTEGQRRTEAQACRELLLDDGVPLDAIYMEESSKSTEENAIYSQEIMQAQGWQTALVVSDAYHVLRASWLFDKIGIDAVFSPVPADEIPRSNYIQNNWRELMAWHWQIIKDGLGLPYTSFPPE